MKLVLTMRFAVATVSVQVAVAKRISIEGHTQADTTRGGCSDYFGEVAGDEQINGRSVITVVDGDVGHTLLSSVYCSAAGMSSPCNYIHYAGPATECDPPSPPDGCHKYVKVTYSECDALRDVPPMFSLAGRIDTTGAFDADGTYTACADNVISREVSCWGAPVWEPESCMCKENNDIPRVRTPNRDGECGYIEVPEPVLADCVEPIAEGIPDFRGVWLKYNQELEEMDWERIEQCGDRIVFTGGGVIHDAPHADGTMEGGVDDISTMSLPDCGPALTVSFRWGEDGCLRMYPFNAPEEATQRCLNPDGSMSINWNGNIQNMTLAPEDFELEVHSPADHNTVLSRFSARVMMAGMRLSGALQR